MKNERPTLLTARVRYWSTLLLAQSDATVSSIARSTGFSRTTVHRVFYGLDSDELLVGTVEAVAVALGVDPGDLFKPMPNEACDDPTCDGPATDDVGERRPS